MKAIENKKVIVAGQEISYAKIIAEHIKTPPQGGFTYDELVKVGRCLPPLEKEGKTINLEDADFEFVKNKIETATWGFYSEVFTKLTEYLKSIK